jgi:hypothetical protein
VILPTLYQLRDFSMKFLLGRLAIIAIAIISLPAAQATTTSSPKPQTRTPRLVRAPYVQRLSATSVALIWNSNLASASVVEYSDGGKKPVWRKVREPRAVRRHVVKLLNLRAGITYSYRILDQSRPVFAGKLQADRAPNQSWSFAAWGDSGTGGTRQKRLAARIEAAKPDLLLHTGDLIYPRGAAHDFDARFFRIYAPLLSRVPFYGTLGNHDVGTRSGQPFLDKFIFPGNGPQGLQAERNYSFEYSNVHFAVVDANASRRVLRDVVAPWLERDLKKAAHAGRLWCGISRRFHRVCTALMRKRAACWCLSWSVAASILC